MSARAGAIAVLVLVMTLAGCRSDGDLVDAGPAPARGDPASAPTASPPTAPSADPPPPTAPAPSVPPATEPPPADEDTEPPEPEPPEPEPEPEPPELTTVTITLTRDDRMEPVRRVVPRVARIGGAAIEQLLAGPTEAEEAMGYRTQIPDDTRLRDLTITDGVALVDLSREFEAGGESTALVLRIAQVVCTLDAFPTVDGVRIAVDGEVAQVVVGDGEVVDEPVACEDYTQVG